MMGRPRQQQQRKTIDEIYGPKTDITPLKVSGAQPTHIANRLQERRLQRESANNAAANQIHGTRQWNSGPGIVGTARGAAAPPAPPAAPAPAPVLPAGNCTYRRKTARQRSVDAKAVKEKTPEKEEKAVIIDKPKKEKKRGNANHTSRADKNGTFRTHVAESTHQYIYTLDDIIQEQQFQQLHMQQTLKNKPQVQIYHRQIPVTQLQQKPSQQSSHKPAAFQQYQQSAIDQEAMYYHHPTHQEHQRQPTVQVVDEDKDEDTEEFFDLIKQTVESAIGKTVSDLLNRNFRDVTTKIDQFSKDLNTTQTMITNMQSDVNNKICHYGEENTRHFRYLCMKSEYDKMFYQHQVLINGNGVVMPGQPPNVAIPGMPVLEVPKAAQTASTMPSQQPVPPAQVPSPPSPQTTVTPVQSSDSPRQTVPVMCNPNTTASDIMNNSTVKAAQPAQQPEASAAITPDPQSSLSTHSSEIHMREVLDHIQRFCVQMQGSETFKVNPNTLKENSSFRPEGAMIINKDVFLENDDEDIDDCMISSDGMTPRSLKQINRYDVKPMQYNVHGAMGDS